MSRSLSNDDSHEIERVVPARSPVRTSPALPASLAWTLELRFWVAACVTAVCAFASRALQLPSQPWVLGTVFASTLAIYNLDGSLDSTGRSQSHSPESPTTAAHWRLTIAAALLGLVCLWQLAPLARLLVVCGAGACLPYAARSGAGRKATIKRTPWLKAPFVGFAVASAVVGVPAAAARQLSPAALLLGSCLGLLCTANAILFDIPDVSDDRAAEVPTLPLLLGVRGARLVASGCCLLGGALALLVGGGLLHGGRVFSPSTLSALIALAAALLLATAIVKRGTARAAVAFWVDGALILPLVVQSLATQAR